MRTVTRADIAQMTGWSYRHVAERITKHPNFPKPVIRLSTQNVRWSEADVREWIRRVSQAA